jgi:MFS transporter, CP family, cyanate transporter
MLVAYYPFRDQKDRALQKQTSGQTKSLPTWLGITTIVMVAIDLRPGIVSIGPVLNSVRGTFDLSHAMASLLTAIPDLLMGALALPTPWMAKKWGRDNTILLALLLLCVSILIRSFARSTTVLLLSTAGVGAGIAVAGALVAGFIKANHADHAAVFMGIYATALSLGSTISAAMTGPVASGAQDKWRFATGMWSALGVFAITAWAVVAVFERKHSKLESSTPQKFPLPIRNKTAWMISTYFALNNLIFYAMIAWIAPVFREFGTSASKAGLLLASFTGVFMLGNPVFGALSKHHDRRVCWQYVVVSP